MREDVDPILVADLAGYIRLTETVPSFVLPVFRETHEGSTATLVQMIADGLVEEFVPFDPENAAIHSTTVQTRRVRAGDLALLAYESFEGKVIIQPRHTLVEYLQTFLSSPELAEKPFSRRELARFCGDRLAQREAEGAALRLLQGRAPRSADYFRLRVTGDSVRQKLAEDFPQLDTTDIQLRINQNRSGIVWSSGEKNDRNMDDKIDEIVRREVEQRHDLFEPTTTVARLHPSLQGALFIGQGLCRLPEPSPGDVFLNIRSDTPDPGVGEGMILLGWSIGSAEQPEHRNSWGGAAQERRPRLRP